MGGGAGVGVGRWLTGSPMHDGKGTLSRLLQLLRPDELVGRERRRGGGGCEWIGGRGGRSGLWCRSLIRDG